jgi:hypothetical protein
MTGLPLQFGHVMTTWEDRLSSSWLQFGHVMTTWEANWEIHSNAAAWHNFNSATALRRGETNRSEKI